MTYQVVLTPTARQMLQSVPDRRIQLKIFERINGLSNEPEKQGKPLTEDLIGYRSLRAVGQRYRIIYKVDRGKVLVVIVALGLRKGGDKKDVYALAKKLIQLKLLGP